MQATKEKAANAAASAKAGMEKTKATMQEKVEKMMTTGDPMEKGMVKEKKEEGIQKAERQKQEAREQNAAARQAATGGGAYGHDYTTGDDYSTISSTERPSSGGYGVDREIRQDYAQAGDRDGSDLVGAEDPNVAVGARSG